MTRLLLVLLTAFVALQFSGGLMRLSRTAPTAICWSLAPSYGENDGSCSHGGGVMIWLSKER